MGQLPVARPDPVVVAGAAGRLQDQRRRGVRVVGVEEGAGVDQPVRPLLGVIVAVRVVLVGAGHQGQPGHQGGAAVGEGEHARDDRGREGGAAVEGHAGRAVARAAAVLVEAGDLGPGDAVAGATTSTLPKEEKPAM
jgi:hypothetical protein